MESSWSKTGNKVMASIRLGKVGYRKLVTSRRFGSTHEIETTVTISHLHTVPANPFLANQRTHCQDINQGRAENAQRNHYELQITFSAICHEHRFAASILGNLTLYVPTWFSSAANETPNSAWIAESTLGHLLGSLCLRRVLAPQSSENFFSCVTRCEVRQLESAQITRRSFGFQSLRIWGADQITNVNFNWFCESDRSQIVLMSAWIRRLILLYCAV